MSHMGCGKPKNDRPLKGVEMAIGKAMEPGSPTSPVTPMRSFRSTGSYVSELCSARRAMALGGSGLPKKKRFRVVLKVFREVFEDL